MKKEIELTVYQQSIIDKPRTFKSKLKRCMLAVFTAMLLCGFYFQYTKSLPPELNSLLMFFSILFTIYGLLGTTFLATVYFITSFYIFTCKKAEMQIVVSAGENSKEINSSNAKLKLVVSMCESGFFAKKGFWYYLIRGLNYALFAMFIVSNHIVLALFHLVNLVSQHILFNKLRTQLMILTSTIEDPLQAEGDINIDDLMDKLCEPDDTSSN